MKTADFCLYKDPITEMFLTQKQIIIKNFLIFEKSRSLKKAEKRDEKRVLNPVLMNRAIKSLEKVLETSRFLKNPETFL